VELAKMSAGPEWLSRAATTRTAEKKTIITETKTHLGTKERSSSGEKVKEKMERVETGEDSIFCTFNPFIAKTMLN
jgi:hypothetical protein